jgi:two-component system sensor histidine kinase MprB
VSFGRRITVLAAAAVAVAIALASVAVWLLVRNELRGGIDSALEERAAVVQVRAGPGGLAFSVPAPPFGGARGYVQVVPSDGPVERLPGERQLLPFAEARDVAAGRRESFFGDTHLSGTHLRVFTTQIAPGLAVVIARPLDEVDRTLNRLGIALVVVALLGVGLASALGTLVARGVLAPVRRLTEAVEHVRRTHDLSRRIATPGEDELSRLGQSFDEMLEELDESLRSQRRLVADASHELRTPLTSVRTNIEVLLRTSELEPSRRERLGRDVMTQLEELTQIVNDVVDLSRGEDPDEPAVEVDLHELVADRVERASRASPHVRFAAQLEPSSVRGVPSRIERAVDNLLDNAAKWSPPGGVVEVEVRNAEVSVRDHGPGIAEADVPRVFDRFYRAPEARSRPGSGLGLAIVRDVAAAHGGMVSAEAASGGGARLRLKLSANS